MKKPTVSEVKVSVLMLTYQHEPFLAQALDSVITQTTDFDFEVVIGDDRSFDGTRDILSAYRERHPEKVRLLLAEVNQGIRKNLRATLRACRGELVALLEGDDYWRHPLKLQRQAELLDAHPEVSLCGHQSVTVEAMTEAEKSTWPHHARSILGAEDALRETLFHTCTMMFRRSLTAELPEAFWSIFPPDRALQIVLAQAGDVAFIEEAMAAYRIHPGGAWSAMSRRRRRETNLEFFRRINEFTAPRHRTLVRDQVYRRWRSVIRESAREGRRLAALGHYARLLASPRIWLHDPRPLVSPGLWSRILGIHASPGELGP